MAVTINRFWCITIFGAVAFLFQSCTGNDRHANVLTLEALIENGEVIVIEKKDSVTLRPVIAFLNDSIYCTQTQYHSYRETKNTKSKGKMVPEVVIENSFALKNIFSGITYISDTLDSQSPVFVNEKNDLMINDVLFLAPDYTSKRMADTIFTKKVIDIKVDTKLKELDEFDESVIYKWTNTGRLGTIHKMFYYQLNGRKFKSTSSCYLIAESRNYFYNDKLGILKVR